jgi:hypothetical protein
MFERCLKGEQGGTVLDARRMSYSTSACYDFAANDYRRSARKASHNFFGSAAVACLVLGCAWTVYSNILAASVYPTLSSANFDAPVTRRSSVLAVGRVPAAANNVLAALPEPAPVVSAPASLSTGATLTFNDRFAAASPQGVEPKPQTDTAKLAEAPKPMEISPPSAPGRVAAVAPATRSLEARPSKTPGASVRDMAQRAKAAVMAAAAPPEQPTIFERLFGKSQSHGSLLSYASADVSSTSSLGLSQNPALGGSLPLYDRQTAVYDISAHMVYLPDGTKLEAHSGLGSSLDDPRSANIRMRGVTPPHLYELTPREALFHGVPALRLKPVGGEDAIYGRAGLLAHTFMLGPRGDSNGCVSFRDYNAFLNAYRNQGVKRLAVVARID